MERSVATITDQREYGSMPTISCESRGPLIPQQQLLQD